MAKDNNRQPPESYITELFRRGFLPTDAAAINSRALTCNIFLNERIIGWLSYKKPKPVRTCCGPFGSSFRVDKKFVCTLNHASRRIYPAEKVAPLGPSVLPLKAWMSPAIMISSAPPPSLLLPVNSCYCLETPLQKCGAWTVFRAIENGYT